MTAVHALSRRHCLVGAAGILLCAPSFSSSVKPLMQVWKDPNCGCCKDWVAHLEKAGIEVHVNETGNAAVRRKLGVPDNLGSCHTGSIGGYAIEGHVPVREIKRLLQEKPRATGLAVPGMPIGSPGMDGAIYGGRKDAFDVLLIGLGGQVSVYQAYR